MILIILAAFAVVGLVTIGHLAIEGTKKAISWGKREEAVAKVKIENVDTWLSKEIRTIFTDTSAVALKKIDAIVAWGKTVEARAEALEAKAAIVLAAPVTKIEDAVKAVETEVKKA